MKVIAEIPEEVMSIIGEFGEEIGRRKLSEEAGISEMESRYYLRLLRDQEEGEVREYNTLRCQLQKQRDKLRIIRNSDRVKDRYLNALTEYMKELINVIQSYGKIHTIEHEIVEGRPSGILQLSDLHFNELIDIFSNRYDFKIGAKRLKKFVAEAKKIFNLYNVNEVLVAMTGDLINSDRRLDELLSLATNRARATFLTEMLLEQVIRELNQEFNVSVAHVSGNESRVGEIIGYTDIMASDNYDTMIYELLKLRFNGQSGIRFIDGDVSELVINLNGRNILMTHGHTLANSAGESGLGRKVQQIKGKYGDCGIIIDYVIFGHLHDTRISDSYARSGSLCGGNAYSDKGLQMSSRASQLVHIVNTDSVYSFKIDVQEYEGYEGYEIEEALEAYSAKSLSKVVRTKKI